MNDHCLLSSLVKGLILFSTVALSANPDSVDDWFDMAFYPGCEPKESGGIVTTLQTRFGMTPDAIRERCLSVALDETADTPKRAGAVRFLCENSPDSALDDLMPFFVHENVQLRNVAVLAFLETASNVVEKLHFAEEVFGRAEANDLFLPAASVVVRRFGQMLQYAPLSVQDRRAILSTFAGMPQKFARPELIRLLDNVVVRFQSELTAEDDIRNADRFEPREADSVKDCSEPISDTECALPSDPPRPHRAWLAAATALFAAAFILFLRRRLHRQSAK